MAQTPRRDHTIAGRRRKSMEMTPAAWKPSVDVVRLFEQLDCYSREHVRALCAANGLPTTDAYVVEFRRQAMWHQQRLAAARLGLSHGPRT
jgi:hypothetical protein